MCPASKQTATAAGLYCSRFCLLPFSPTTVREVGVAIRPCGSIQEVLAFIHKHKWQLHHVCTVWCVANQSITPSSHYLTIALNRLTTWNDHPCHYTVDQSTHPGQSFLFFVYLRHPRDRPNMQCTHLLSVLSCPSSRRAGTPSVPGWSAPLTALVATSISPSATSTVCHHHHQHHARANELKAKGVGMRYYKVSNVCSFFFARRPM